MHKKIKAPPKHRLLALLLAAIMTLALVPSPVRVALADDTGTVELTCNETRPVPTSGTSTGVYEGTINGMSVVGVCGNADVSMPGSTFDYEYVKKEPMADTDAAVWLAAIMAVYGTSDTHTDMQAILNYINDGDLNSDSIFGWMHIILSALHSDQYGGVSAETRTKVDAYKAKLRAVIADATYSAYAASVMDRYYCYYGAQPSGTGWQDLFFVGTKPPAKLKIKKSSAVPALTDGNSCYSLEGAVFGLYYSEADAWNNSNQIGRMETDANGDTNIIDDLDAIQYWVYEVAVPRGYAKMPRPVAVTPRLGETTTVNIADYPQSDPVGILLRKVDATTGGAPASSQLSLAGAEFTVRYYDGQYSTAAAAEASGSPTRAWVFKTNSSGEVRFRASDKVSGDELYLNPNNLPTLPLGTLVIFESKAPTGYQLNSEKFVRNITADGNYAEVVETYNAPTVPETHMTMHLVKTTSPDQADKSGFQFRVTGPNSFSKTVTTNTNGTFDLVIPAAGTYTVTELARDGWTIDGTNPQTVTFAGTAGETKTVTFSNSKLFLSLSKTTDWPADDPSGFAFRVTGPNSFSRIMTTGTDGTWRLQVPAYGSYTVTELRQGKALNYEVLASQTVTFDASHKNISVTFANKVKRCELHLVKTSEDGVVDGLTFRITGPNGYNQLHTTANGGKIKVENLLPGTYTVTETRYGRYKENAAQTVTLEPGDTATVNFENKLIRGGVKIAKVDADTLTNTPQGDATLEGAKYDIVSLNEYPVTVNGEEYAQDAVVLTLTTDANGEASTAADTLPYGRYRCVESYVPEGYLAAQPENPEFTITEDGVIVDKTLTPFAEPVVKGRIRLIKHSDEGDTGMATPEEGAKFQVWLTSSGSYAAAKETERDTLTIDADGVAISKLLPYGTYTVHQASGWPSSAKIDDFQVVVREDGKQYSFILNNQTYTGYLKIIKTNARTGETIPVAGVGFKLYSPTGDLITFFGQDTWYSGADGLVRVPVRLSYNYGYYLMEVPGTEPEGFVRATEPVYFDLTPDTLVDEYDLKIVPVSFPNEETKVQVFKLDADGEALPGATLAVLDSEENEIERWTTTDEPHIVYQLHVGESYTLRELEPAPTYVKALDVRFMVQNTPELQPVRMIDKQLTAEKVDADGNPVTGAKLAVYSVDENGNADEKLDEWITDGTPHAVEGLTVGMDAILRELATPEGYAKAKDVTFTVEDDGADQSVTMIDKRITVSKLDVAGDELPGAAMSVTDAETGKTVDAWTSSEEPHAINGLEVGHRYVLKEDTAPLGYCRALEIAVTVTDDGVDQHYDVTDKIVTVEKVDVTGNPVVGATLAVYSVDAEGNADEKLDEWISDGTPHAVNGLTVGMDAILRELEAAPGYVKALDVPFTVADDGENQSVVMVDKTVIVAKLDVSGVALPGATLAAIDAETGKTVDKWTSTDTPHAVNGLEVGRRYVLRELEPVAGYVKAADVEFTVADDGENQRVVMIDKIVAVEKVDADGNPVIGATLAVYTIKENGNADKKLDEWISDGTPHAVNGLTAGNKYILRELKAAPNYVKAADVEFTVLDDGANQSVTMIDKTVIVDKVDPFGNGVEGAELAVYAVKPNGKAGKCLDQWTTDGTPHAVSGLTAGNKYILRELVAPEGWLLAEDVIFTVADDGKNQVITMEDEEIPVIHTVATIDGEHVAYANGTLELAERVYYDKVIPGRKYTMPTSVVVRETKKPLLDKDGKPVMQEITFTPTKRSGFIDVTFTIDASELAGKTIVVFDDLYRDGRLLAEHRNINDENQSVHFPVVTTSATVDGEHVVIVTDKAVVTEAVAYRNLPVGRTYTIRTVAMVKETGKPLKDSDGKEITAEGTFTPETMDGDLAPITLTFDASRLANLGIVIFEYIYDGDKLIYAHDDINDLEQTVRFKPHPVGRLTIFKPTGDVPGTGDDGTLPLYAGLGAASLIGVACWVFFGQRKKGKREM